MARETATIRDVARKAGVAVSTASRALGNGSASTKTRLKVQHAAEELHFVPNPAARLLTSGRSNIVAIVVTESPEFVFKDAFTSGMVSLLMNSFAQERLLPFLVAVDSGDAVDFDRLLRNSGADGMVIVSFHYSKKYSKVVQDFGRPTLFVGKPPSGMNYPYVDADQVQGGYIAGQVLMKRGRRHIAIIEGPKDMRSPKEVNNRTQGCLQALAAYNAAPIATVSGPYNEDHGIEAMEQILKRAPEVDGVFAHSDQIAAGVLQYLHHQHKRIPDDISVVGFDDFQIANAVSPRLTTIAQPLYDMAQAATEMLTYRLKKGSWKTNAQIFPVHLVERESI